MSRKARYSVINVIEGGNNDHDLTHFFLLFIKSLQEDLAANDVEEIIDDLIAGKTPKAGPRYASYR